MSNPLVSITIPTFNSAKTLRLCLESIVNQTYGEIEIVVVDSNSSDDTWKIAKEFKVDKLISTEWGLLGSRCIGSYASTGKFVLMLDSDQVLEGTAIERGVELFNGGYGMLALEENSLYARNWLEKMFKIDRELINRMENLDPETGVILPRFFRKSIIDHAFEMIPRELLSFVVTHDHAIIYYEAYKVSSNVGILPNSVFHIEPSSLIDCWKKNYGYGRKTKRLIETNYYNDLLKTKIRARNGFSVDSRRAMIANILLLLKASAYELGRWLP